MELICPSCEARYGIPDGSIGEKGRQVSCMNCGHGWHAFPPLVLGAAQAAGTPAAGMQWRDPEGGSGAPAWSDSPAPSAALAEPESNPTQTGANLGAFAAATGSLGSGARSAVGDGAERTAASRNEQLMEIRETLAEIQSEERASATSVADAFDDAPPLNDFRKRPGVDDLDLQDRSDQAGRETTRLYSDATHDMAEDDLSNADGEVDLLRRRMEQSEEKEKAKPADVRRLRKRHDRKAKQATHRASAGSGAFLTGFLLVAIIASVLIALYLLAPQIIERVPAAEQPMNEYVATIDGLRVSVAETYQSVAGWVSESLEGKI